MILMNNYKAALISSQAHAKSNKKEMLSAFVIDKGVEIYVRISIKIIARRLYI